MIFGNSVRIQIESGLIEFKRGLTRGQLDLGRGLSATTKDFSSCLHFF